MNINEILHHCSNSLLFAGWLIIIAFVALMVEWVIHKIEGFMDGGCRNMARLLRLAALALVGLECVLLVWFATSVAVMLVHPSPEVWRPVSL